MYLFIQDILIDTRIAIVKFQKYIKGVSEKKILSQFGFIFILVKLENNSKFFDLPNISNVCNMEQGDLIIMFQPILSILKLKLYSLRIVFLIRPL